MKQLQRTLKRLRPWHLGLLLAVASVIAYDPTRLENTSGDNISARYWPVAILKHGTFTLNPFKVDLKEVAYTAIYRSDGTWLPRHDLGLGLLTVPFYAAVDILGGSAEWTHDRISQVSRWNAIALSIGATLILYAFLLRLVSLPSAFLASALFAFGTWHWSLGAQGISPQLGAVFWLTLRLHLLVWVVSGARSKRLSPWTRAAALGAFDAVIWFTRSSDLLLLVPTVLWVFRSRREVLAYGAGFALLFGPEVAIHSSLYGSWMGFRGLLGTIISDSGAPMYGNPLEGLLGILFSPNRGALFFFPLLFLMPWFWLHFMPKLHPLLDAKNLLKGKLPSSKQASTASSILTPGLSACLFYGVALYLAQICCLQFWHSTWSYGPRYLYDPLPYLWPVVALGIEAARKRKITRGLTGLAVLWAAWGVLIHGLGHRNFHLYLWNGDHVQTEDYVWDVNPAFLEKVWDAGSNRHVYPSALGRLKSHGY